MYDDCHKVCMKRVYTKKLSRIRKARWTAAGQCPVPIDSLVALQSIVYVDKVIQYAQHPNTYEPVTVVITPYGILLWNGHHRAHAQMIRGRKNVWADVYTVDL